MTASPPTTAVPRPAASLLLLRDGRGGIEVLMVERTGKASFAAGALVFPGGTVDPEDHRLCRLCADGADPADPSLPFRVAAIRETFEECGLFLARPRAGGAFTGPAPTLSGPPDEGAFEALLTRREAVLSSDRLVPFAHWITPVHLPKRFDTHFFAAPAPEEDQAITVDGREVVHGAWVSPAVVVEEAESGQRNLMFATYMMLRKLRDYPTAAEALDAARETPIVPVLPEAIDTPEGRAFRIPEAAGYGETLVLEKRFRRV